MLRYVTVVVAFLGSLIGSAAAQQGPRSSECLAMANAGPRVQAVSFAQAAANGDQVAITYAGHSTYYIEDRKSVV